ncbi:MAG: long-chain fatty acid--CoA ligase [Planctomycetota bacterium]|nr:MAG: long-chain fatty acid--CoA ligase [Planctomycetota bacterium]
MIDTQERKMTENPYDRIEMDWLAKRAQEMPNRKVLSFNDKGYTFQEFNQTVNRIVGALEDKIKAGDRVGILALNSPYHLFLAFACWRLGACLVPLNYRLSQEELKQILDDCQPSLIFVDKHYSHIENGIPLEELYKWKREPAEQPYPIQPEDPALILYTSGTTGRPKGAILSHRMILANIRFTQEGWELKPEDRTLIFAPLFHTGGWNVLTLPLLHMGGHVRLMENFDVPKVLHYLKQGEGTILFGVPTMFQMMADQWNLTERETKQIRFFISGGAPCPVELWDWYLGKGIAFRQGYGMTEVGPNCFYFPESFLQSKKGKVGLPMKGTFVKTVGEGEVGELYIGGPHVFSGYLNRPEETAKTLVNGMVATGDLARIDQDGFVEIVGRKKEMFISGGENVYPQEICMVMDRLEEIRESYVIGVGHKKWGEVGFAFLVLEKEIKNEKEFLEELKQYLREKLAHYKVPKYYKILNQLPRNSMGKVIKGELEKMAKDFISNLF